MGVKNLIAYIHIETVVYQVSSSYILYTIDIKHKKNKFITTHSR